MNPDVNKVLKEGEEVFAKVSGRTELSFGGVVVSPTQGIVLATNQRILYFVRIEKGGLNLETEIPLNDVAKISVYRDIFNSTLGLCETLHLQSKNGDLIRIIGPEEYDGFLDYVNSKINNV